jgi:Fur family ferric uptake transcriptional regulator
MEKGFRMDTTRQRRNTPQRRVILEELQGLTSHPTAAELFSLVRKKLPRISLGTVYRNLEVLHEDGQLIKLELAGAETRFDGNTTPHLHIRCTACGAVRDVTSITPPPDPPAQLEGFEVHGCRTEFFGICPDCRPSVRH